ncbi:MAG: DUF6273 domain-containing protein [bacterium]|nr:DUF6273 domain-containing protein [bacterium]
MKKIIKRIVSLNITAAMLVMLIPVIAGAGMSIQIGQYVQMGTYYGEPILWRCVDIDENGPLMLSDKIICIKPFDAEGDNTSGSHGRGYDDGCYRKQYGSNYWADSNMRCWLNSTASAGNVEWTCGNPPTEDKVWNGYNEYADEAGFLTNFSQEERNAVKAVTQKSLLDGYEHDSNNINENYHRYDYHISGVVQNYDSAYSENVTDKMFLLDVKQVNTVYNNRNILGSDYYIGEPTAQAVENSEYKNSGLRNGNKWHYWLRSPYSNNISDGARVVDSGGPVHYTDADYTLVGVRPAFYLNLLSSSIKSGTGTESNPYTIDGGSGGNTNSGTNSTSADAPVITSAKLTHSGKTYDIFSQAVTIEKDSEIMASIEAAVNANGNKDVKVYITQGVGKEFDITNVCKDFTPGKDFSAGKPIYIMAVDKETGKSTSRKTKLKISSMASGKIGNQSGVDGLNFKLGQDTGFTIPDSVPVFGGTEIKWTFDFIPISVEYDKEDNNKLNVVLGTNITKKKGDDGREYFSDFNFKEYKKSVKKAASKQNRSLKQLRNDFKMTKDIKMNMFGGNVLKGGSGKGGSSVDVAGYAEMHYTENGWQFAEGQLCVDVEFTYNYQGQIFIWVVPLYYEFGGGAGVGFEGDMKDINPISFSPEFEAYITGKVKGSIGGGVGVAKVATAGASGKAALNLKKSLKDSYFKADVDGSASFSVKVFGKTVAEKEFAKGNFLIYETGNSKGLIKDGGVSLKSAGEDLYSIDINAVYENESRAYAESPTAWLGNEEQLSLMSVDYTNKDIRRLAENIYTECMPQLCSVDGKTVMVMQWDNTMRADIDRTMLVYSVYDEVNKTWSEPEAVYDDGTADYYPEFKDGYLVWQNEKSQLTDDMTLEQIAELGEICVSKWNGSGFDAPIALTDNNMLDTQPSVTKTSDGVHIIWTTNTANDIMGTSGTNTVMQSYYDGTAWSAAMEIKSGLNAVTNITSGAVNGNLCIAYVCDDDNDLNTIDDRDIAVIDNGTERRLTDDDTMDSNPIIANDMIYYYHDGNIEYRTIDGGDMQTVFEEAKEGLTDTFKVGANNSGDIVIWWTKANENGSEVYSSLYKDGEWSDEIKVTDLGSKAKYPNGILNDDGVMHIAFNNGIEEDNSIIRTDLYTISIVPSYDLELADAYFDEDKMTAYAVVKNNGELKIPGYTIAIDDDGINSQKTITEPLKAGESAEVEIEYNKPSNLSARAIAMTVAAVSGEEYNTDNNSAEFEIGHADIEVGNVAVNDDETTVSADISNVGYDNAENVKVQLRDERADGAVIEEKTINLNIGSKESVEFSFDKSDMRFFDASKQLYVTAQISGGEVSLGNNDGYVVIMSESGAADYETEILSYNEIDGKYVINSVARNNTDTAVSCVMYSAVYSEDGTLKACGTVKADIDADNDTGVDIIVPCTIATGDTIKTFMWTDKQEPLANVGELVIE